MTQYACQIEISQQCNYSCMYCFNKNPLFLTQNNELSISDWIEILKTITSDCFSTLIISGGEPLLKKNFYKIIESVDPNINDFIILTNGSLLDKAALSNLNQYRNNIIFQLSLDGISSKTHEYYRKGHQSWLKTMECLINLSSMGKNKFDISTVISKNNLNQITDLTKLAYAFGASQIHFSECLCWDHKTGLFQPNLSINERKYLVNIIRKLKKEWDGWLGITLTPSYDKYIELLLHANWEGVVIRADGSYSADCLIPICLSSKHYPMLTPKQALCEISGSEYIDKVKEYLSNAHSFFVRNEVKNIIQKKDPFKFIELYELLILKDVDKWRGTLSENYDKMVIEQNNSMELIVDGFRKSITIGQIAKQFTNIWGLDMNIALIDTLIGARHLVKCNAMRWV